MDKARKQTDKLLNQMEKKISKIYDQAYKDLSKSWNQFMAVHKPMVQDAYDKLQDALKGGSTKEIFDARTEYERVLNNTILQNERYKAMTDELAEKISHVNEVALDYVNGNMAKVYTTNYNAFGDEKIDGYSFSLTNEQAVKNLAKSDKALLPTKQLNKNKDLKWNHKQINSQMMQGIIQGESIPKLAKRLENVIGMDKNSSIRNARTMTTAAENKGRQDSFEKAQEDGVIMTREWIATGDDRTRDWHLELDGVEVAVDEPWVNTLGDGTEDEIMYPGDPDADPANTYNCRCSIRVHVQGFKWSDNAEVDIEEEEESKPSDNLSISDDIKPETRQVIESLYDDYDSHLTTVTHEALGGKGVKGDTDITGEKMRLATSSPVTAIHEFAHTMANSSADKMGISDDSDFWKEIKKIRTEYREAISNNPRLKISPYADSPKTKIDEFMAESFTQVKALEFGVKLSWDYGKDLTYATKVVDVIDKYFRRKHK